MKVSASRLPLLAECQHWPNLVGEDDPPSEAGETGKAIHSMIEAARTGSAVESGPLADMAKCAKLLTTWQAWWPGYSIVPSQWRHEVAILYDWTTGKTREMPAEWVKGKRERADTELPAILDVVGGGKTVLDWKSGAKRETSAQSVQLKLQALAAHRQYGWDEVRVGLVYLRVRKIDDPELVTYDAMDLADFEAELRGWMEAIPLAQPRPGAHCFRCNGKRMCAALMPRGVDFDDVFSTKETAA